MLETKVLEKNTASNVIWAAERSHLHGVRCCGIKDWK